MMIGDGVNFLRRLAVRAACFVMVALLAWSGPLVPSANAVGSESAAEVVNSRAAAELDRVAGAGTSDQVEGAVDSVVGKAKRGIGRVSDEVSGDGTLKRVEGAADQLEGKVKRGVGQAKSAAADAGEDIEDSANGIVDSIKDLFD
ncbi:MAG: CsbD family protein [Cyanobacteria bacterium J06614_10]